MAKETPIEVFYKPHHYKPKPQQSSAKDVLRESVKAAGLVAGRHRAPVAITFVLATALLAHINIPKLHPSIQTSELTREFGSTGHCRAGKDATWATVFVRDWRIIRGSDRAATPAEIAACRVIPLPADRVINRPSLGQSAKDAIQPIPVDGMISPKIQIQRAGFGS